MKNIIHEIKGLLGKYEPNYEYWINREKIKVNPDWRKTKIGKQKFSRKIQHWYKTGNFASPIILDKDFNLIDGYSSVVITELKNLERVPVYFID